MNKVLLAFVTLFALSADVFAADKNLTSARSQARNIIRQEKSFKKLVSKLSVADRERLKAALAAIDSDSDGDGASDLIEGARGSLLCDADSDDDGIDDGNDDYENSRDGDGDGHDDSSEVSGKGKITSFVDPTLEVAGKTFTVTDATSFKGRNFTKASLTAGTCVEVEGHTDNGANIADKIKKEDSCR
jgi:hypothetical protein